MVVIVFGFVKKKKFADGRRWYYEVKKSLLAKSDDFQKWVTWILGTSLVAMD